MSQSKEVGSAVLFDLDDTLYSRRAAFSSWLDTYLRDTLRLTDPTEIERVRDLIASLDRNGYGSKQAIFERLHMLYPTLPGEASRSLDTFFIEFLTHVKPEAETETLLDTLAAAGIPFGVVTNGSARQWRKIEALGLDKRTPCLFVSETFGLKKPDPAIFHAAADCLSLPPSGILFVGDNPTADILGAHAAGMPAAWLHRGQTWPTELEDKPEFAIDSLNELVGILRLNLFKHGIISVARSS
ncbi:MAG: HAD family hydrolase [Janthinobacterium lividum]